MSLQQALRQIPSVNRVEKLRCVINENRWSASARFLDPKVYRHDWDFQQDVIKSRQAFFTAQDELNRILGRG